MSATSTIRIGNPGLVSTRSVWAIERRVSTLPGLGRRRGEAQELWDGLEATLGQLNELAAPVVEDEPWAPSWHNLTWMGACISQANMRVTSSSATWKVRCKADCVWPICSRRETVSLPGDDQQMDHPCLDFRSNELTHRASLAAENREGRDH
jgi:hypothetical protein